MVKSANTNCTRPKYLCGNHKIKLIGTVDGLFPDFGHHLEKEMGGLWLYPVKLIDGFWLKVTDCETHGLVDGYMEAGTFENYPHKNIFTYSGSTMGHTPIIIKRTQIVPEGIAGIKITYDFHLPEKDSGGKGRKIIFDFLTRVNLRPDWLAEEVGVFDGSKEEINYDEITNTFLAKDNQNPWYVCIGADFQADDYLIGNEFGQEIVGGNGGSIRLTKEIYLEPGDTQSYTFYVTGSLKSAQECISQYEKITKDKNFEEEKLNQMENILSYSRLEISDKEFTDIYDWIKIHTDWLTLEVEGIGKGITAGIPEYVWWFGCDSCYAIQGMMMQGNFELCKNTIQLILKYSQELNGNGRIIHELLPNGHSPNLGNTQETAHFIYLLWEYYQWTGDKSILRECYEYISKSVEWLLAQDDDNDFFPTGYGIIEIAGLNMEMIDTAVYTSKAYQCYSMIAKVLGQVADPKWEDLATQSAEAINTLLWDEKEGLYCDCFASTEKILEKKDMILGQMQESGDDLARQNFLTTLKLREEDLKKEHGWILNKNWVINVPMEVGIANEEKAGRTLERMNTGEFIGSYGMYLEGLRKGAAMTISTGVMAVAQARYGYADRALELIERIFKSFSMATPGSISEMSPDYGCFVQAWTAYGVMVPIVKYFFGIQPDAAENVIYINPKLPSKWKEGAIEKVRVLDGEIDIALKEEQGRKICTIANRTNAKLECNGDYTFIYVD